LAISQGKKQLPPPLCARQPGDQVGEETGWLVGLAGWLVGWLAGWVKEIWFNYYYHYPKV